MNELKGLESERQRLQAELDAAKTSTERNRLGQFATPMPLALEIMRHAKTLLSPHAQVRFLDPAFGTGAFYSALLQEFPSDRISAAHGFEIDIHYGVPSSRLWHGSGLDLTLGDFTSTDLPKGESEQATLLICNPPYVRHHHIVNGEKRRLQEAARRASGVHITGLTGLYCYFMALAHAWLADGGLAAWLIPSEFMDVNYGKAIKQYLLDRVTLLRIHRFDPEEVQFDDALVSSTVVWLRKEAPTREHAVEFTFGGSLACPHHRSHVPSDVLQSEPKWSRFPLGEIRETSAAPTLGDFFTIKRGLATGDNKFFVLSRERADALDLPEAFLIPILPSPRYVRTDEIAADAAGNPMLDRRLFLLDCRLPEPDVQSEYPALWRYLVAGIPDVSGRYLCRMRSPWYVQEKRPAAPLLCTYMGRSTNGSGRPFRFILNRSRATAANVYLLLYPRPALAAALESDPELIDRIWTTLNRTSPQELVAEGRTYGGGLHKLEPKELSSLRVEWLMAEVGATAEGETAAGGMGRTGRLQY